MDEIINLLQEDGVDIPSVIGLLDELGASISADLASRDAEIARMNEELNKLYDDAYAANERIAKLLKRNTELLIAANSEGSEDSGNSEGSEDSENSEDATWKDLEIKEG